MEITNHFVLMYSHSNSDQIPLNHLIGFALIAAGAAFVFQG